MIRTMLLSTAWLGAMLVFYATMVGLEVDWNLFDWRPGLDWKFIGLLLAALMILGGMWLLAKARARRFVRAWSLLLSLALVAVGFYVVWPEPHSEGLFAREVSSPFWYRGGRLMLMCAPLVFWTLGRTSSASHK